MVKICGGSGRYRRCSQRRLRIWAAAVETAEAPEVGAAVVSEADSEVVTEAAEADAAESSGGISDEGEGDLI